MLKFLFFIFLLINLVLSIDKNIIIVFDTNQLKESLNNSDYVLLADVEDANKLKQKTNDEFKDILISERNFLYKKIGPASNDGDDIKNIMTNLMTEFEKNTINYVEKSERNEPQVKFKTNIINNKLELMEGGDLQIDCIGVSLTKFSLKWLYNNEDVLENTSADNIADLSLNIENITMTQNGSYYCVAENEDGKTIKIVDVTVKKSPLSVNVTRKKDTVVEGTNSVTLICNVSPGHEENVTVFWTFNNDIELPSYASMNGTNLKLTGIKKEMSGDYTCCGQLFKLIKCEEFKLVVQYPPVLIDDAKEYNLIPIGFSTNITCNAEAEPLPYIHWIINTKDDTKTLNMSYVSIENMTANHEGNYICHVSNGHGESLQRNVTIELNAIESPKIIRTNESIIITNIGDNLEMQCKCYDCTPINKYIWMLDTDEINENNTDYQLFNGITYEQDPGDHLTEIKVFRYILNITDISIDDQGTYKCIFSNEHGEDEQTFVVKVLTPTNIEELTEINDNMNVIEGSTAHLKCEVNGEPITIVQWTKDGLPFLSNQEIANDSVIVSDVKFEDAGVYTCFAYNHRSLIVRNFTLLVISPSKITNDANKLLSTVSGETVILPCQLFPLYPSEITWFSNGHELSTNNKSKYTAENNALSFQADPTDTGIYECRVKNDTTDLTEDTILVVYVPPSIYPAHDEVIKVTSNSELVLNCETIGYPSPEKSWQTLTNDTNDTSIEEMENVTTTDHGDLLLSNITIDSQGVYICKSHNIIGTTQKKFSILVFDPPEITSDFVNETVLLPGDNIILKCEAFGNPHPKIIWKKDGEIVDEQLIINNGLKITSRDKKSAGNYTCRAENSQGFSERNISIKIIHTPQILPGFTSPQLKYISSKPSKIKQYTLVCPIDVKSNITWTHTDFDGNLLDKDGNLLIMNDGLHTCTVKNEAGEASFTFQLYTSAPPSNVNANLVKYNFTTTLDDTYNAMADEHVEINCVADCVPPCQKAWYDENDHVVSNSDILQFPSITLEQNGTYICNASNDEGYSIRPYTIFVEAPPTYVNKDLEQYIPLRYGSELRLDCIATGNPEPTITWFKNNEKLTENPNILLIENTEPSDMGLYKCLLENNHGSIEVTYRVDVLDIKNITFISENKEIILIKNQEVELNLTCKVTSYLYPNVSWVFNKNLLSTTNNAINLPNFKNFISNSKNTFYIGGSDSNDITTELMDLNYKHYYSEFKHENIDGTVVIIFNLIIPNVYFYDSGEYTCYVENEMGALKKETYVTVSVPPYVDENIEERKEIQLIAGLPLHISCNITAYPVPTIEWFKNDYPINDGNDNVEIFNSGKLLRIEKIEAEHQGEYFCKGTNIGGELKLYFDVVVLVPPKPLFPDAHTPDPENLYNIEQKSVLEGDSLELTCDINKGSPAATIYWYKYDYSPTLTTILLAKNTDILRIPSIKRSDHFMCFGNNTLGSAMKLFHVNVRAVPIIKDSNIEDIKSYETDRTIELFCKATGDPEPRIRWEKDGQMLSPEKDEVFITDDGSLLKISYSKLSDTGLYDCIAENKFGIAKKKYDVRIYDEWSPWSKCSTTCGKGVKTRNRICASSNSITCSRKPPIQTYGCESAPCPINGQWSEWSDWGPCSLTCVNEESRKESIKYRTRQCNSPAPQYNGLQCEGSSVDKRICDVNICIVDGIWSEWKNVSICSALCGRGKMLEKRTCTPSVTGRTCIGESEQYVICQTSYCEEHLNDPCSQGFVLNKEINECVDINECNRYYRSCDSTRRCVNTFGGYYCECPEGFSADRMGSPCEKINEIPMITYCKDKQYNGRRRCVCPRNMILNSDNFTCRRNTRTTRADNNERTRERITCNVGFKYSDKAEECVDLDECKETNHKCAKYCQNLHGSYMCGCDSDETLASDKRNCIKKT